METLESERGFTLRWVVYSPITGEYFRTYIIPQDDYLTALEQYDRIVNRIREKRRGYVCLCWNGRVLAIANAYTELLMHPRPRGASERGERREEDG